VASLAAPDGAPLDWPVTHALLVGADPYWGATGRVVPEFDAGPVAAV
jgi:hypothetical protein